MQAYKDMFWDWAGSLGVAQAQTFISSYAPPNLPTQQNAFLTGKLGFMISGDWVLGNIQTYVPNLKYGVTYIPVPHAGDAAATWAGGWSMVIPKGPKNGKGGYEFMKYIAGEPGQRVYTKETQHTPTFKSLTSDSTLFPGDHSFFSKQLSAAHSRPPLPVGGLYWDQLSTAQDAATRHTTEPAAALATAASATNDKLKQYCPLA